MFIYLNKRGQSTLEYGIVIAIVVAALIAMQVYIKRGVQGRLKQASDDIGEQFSPATSTSEYTTTIGSTSKETVSAGTTKTEITRGEQKRTGSESIGTHDEEPLE